MTDRELPIDSNFNIKNSDGDLIGTLTTSSSMQIWTWDNDKGSAWPSHDFVLQHVSSLGSLGSNVSVYKFQNNSGYVQQSSTIYAPYYKVEVSSHRRFQYQSANQRLYWVSKVNAALPAATMSVHYEASGSHTSSYYRYDNEL